MTILDDLFGSFVDDVHLEAERSGEPVNERHLASIRRARALTLQQSGRNGSSSLWPIPQSICVGLLRQSHSPPTFTSDFGCFEAEVAIQPLRARDEKSPPRRKSLKTTKRRNWSAVAVLISVVICFTGSLRLTIDLDFTAVSSLRRLGR